MSGKKSAVLCVCVLAAAGLTAVAYTSAFQRIEPSNLHPQRSILYFEWDGSKQHEAALKDTAQYKALVESGLFDYGMKLIEQSTAPLVSQLEPGASEEDVEKLTEAKSTLRAVYEQGFSISATDGSDGRLSPMATVVIHGAAGAEDRVAPLLAVVDIRDEPEQKEVRGRTVNFLRNPSNPAIELAWWSEQQHLVIAVGEQPAERVAALAEGDAANVTTNELYKKCRGETDFEVAAAGWLDIGSLRNRFGGMPVPIPDLQRAVSINELAEILGLHNLNSLGGQFGYRGKASVARTFVDAPGPRSGLLALIDQPLFTIDDLPALPPDSLTFGAFSVDAVASLDTTLETVQSFVSLLPPDASRELNEGLDALPQILGFNLRDDLLASLGDIHCVYSDPAGGPLGLGFGGAISVKDAAKLKAIVNVLAERAEGLLQQAEAPIPLAIQRSDSDGRELLTIPAGMFTPTISVGDKWMVFGLYPQTVKTFFMREDGRLPRWKPSADHQEALAEMPKKFSAISIDDPRQGLRALYSFVPVLNSGIHTMAPSFGPDAVKAADLPPQEIVIAPLFPNVTMSVPGDSGIDYHTRQSLPLTPIPAAESGVAVPVLIALLLPAVQQAREAARRTHSKNNLRQLGLAMHNYHDSYLHLPIGTEPDTKLKPEKRLSFLYAIMPFMEQQALHDVIEANRKLAWDDPAIAEFTSATIATFVNPGLENGNAGITHYVGMAGVGEDAAELEIGHPRAGMFGHDRKTRFRDVIDGLSNTIMMTETFEAEIPWAAGSETIRSLTQEPYINGPDGIGGPSPGGCNILLGDGSVMFLSENIDPEVMRRLAAMADGKDPGDFWDQ